jgi:hypothetical protein
MIDKIKIRWAQIRAIFADETKPLIYCSFEGKPVNLLLSALVRKVEWKFSKDQIEFHEIYTYRGIVVKSGMDIFKTPEGTEFNLQGLLNG